VSDVVRLPDMSGRADSREGCQPGCVCLVDNNDFSINQSINQSIKPLTLK